MTKLHNYISIWIYWVSYCKLLNQFHSDSSQFDSCSSATTINKSSVVGRMKKYNYILMRWVCMCVLCACSLSNPFKVERRRDMREKSLHPEDIPEIGEGCGLHWQRFIIALDFIRQVACVLRKMNLWWRLFVLQMKVHQANVWGKLFLCTYAE